ncbi:uncharacterized protein LOC122512406 [Leptopilina heterotoma]|uniref:uncharacterized protein LOC122512406 n=1 Tax=Leptopilina heterotoma TaxID=63436 RepID=UPI001CA85BA1|nr:uncharacterized protein LOC122512406 [Leptopilina heterotoma]
MQGVLSIQTARGFGESSEFVTKRSCISFLFAIGFLCLLGGFMLGRFAVHRTFMARAERTRMEFAKNGLEMTEHLQYNIIDYLQDEKFIQNHSLHRNNENSLVNNNIRDKFFSEFRPFFEYVENFKSCSIGKIQGSRETDRFVIVSLIEKEFQIMMEIIRSLTKIHVEQDWNPRRTIFFCVCSESAYDCYNELSTYIQSKIVAFISQADENNFTNIQYLSSSEENCLSISGSNIAATAVQDAANFVKLLSKSFNTCHEREFNSLKLELNIPQAVISFVEPKQENNSLVNKDHLIKNRKIMAQVIALSVWRLSESIILPWNPKYLNNTLFRNLKKLEPSRLFENHQYQKIIDLNKLTDEITGYVENLNSLEIINLLDARIANDRLLDLDKIFLCLGSEVTLHRLRECYKNLNEISRT